MGMSMDTPDVADEASTFVNSLYERLPQHIDGRRAILAMKETGSNHWKQMEWIGFYFEEVVMHQLELDDGPTISGTTFDAEREHVWDIKAHTLRTESGNKRYDMYLNDAYSMEQCIENGGMGFLVAHVDAEYDENQTFYNWHQDLKGGASEYTKKRRERGAPSRTRKYAFDFEELTAYWIDDLDALDAAIESGWISQRGQGRNCNGAERKDKYVLKPHNVPDDAIIAHREF